MWSNFKACILGVGELCYQLYECPAAPITKLHKSGGLKPQKIHSLIFWKPGVRNQGEGRAALPVKAPVEGLVATDIVPTSAYVFSWPLPCVSLCVIFSSFKTTDHWTWDPSEI